MQLSLTLQFYHRAKRPTQEGGKQRSNRDKVCTMAITKDETQKHRDDDEDDNGDGMGQKNRDDQKPAAAISSPSLEAISKNSPKETMSSDEMPVGIDNALNPVPEGSDPTDAKTSSPTKVSGKQRGQVQKVLVLGAGISGLAAANELQSRGYSVLVLEARQRVGGRLKGGELELLSPTTENNTNGSKDPAIKSNTSQKPPTVHIDLGGALIHGIIDNPVYGLVHEEMGFPVRPVHDTLLLSGTGWPIDPKEDERVSQIFNDCLEETFQRIHKFQAEPNGESDNGDESTTAISVSKQSFGDIFEQVCAGRNVNTQAALFKWHLANLEVSCGAGFPELGLLWNEDEQFGYDGEHVALPTSWRSVCQALAEPLNIVYDAVVKSIQIIHPNPEDNSEENNTEDVEPISELQQPAVHPMIRKSSRQVKPRQDDVLLPYRQSRRLRGEDALVRRSLRSNKGSGITPFTIDHTAPQVLRKQTDRKRQERDYEKDKRSHTVVQVQLSNGTTLYADAVVCTLPLGILKTGDIIFDPPLPPEKHQAIERLGSGLLNKCALTFAKPFWQDSDFLGLADETHSYLILNSWKVTGKPVLLFMYGGAFAREIENWNDAEIVEDCLAVLRRICGHHAVTAPLDYYVTRWGKEQFSRMAFTYIPPGVDGYSELQAMSRPVYDHTGTVPVLMFAGEHTTPYHPSTIHGAFLSGIREAYRLDCILEPDANDDLEFSDDYVFQKTFLVKRKVRSSDATNKPAVSPAAAIANLRSPKPQISSSQRTVQHRRRGGGVTMQLRRRPKTILKQDASVEGTLKKSEVSEPRTIELNERNTVFPSRRSQRSNVASGLLSSSSSNNPSPIPFHSASEDVRDTKALEDRILVRSIESYGDSIDYIRSVVLPVHGDEIYTPANDHRLQRRCHRLWTNKPKTPEMRRSFAVHTWKAWLVKPTNAETSDGLDPKKVKMVQATESDDDKTQRTVKTRAGRISRPPK